MGAKIPSNKIRKREKGKNNENIAAIQNKDKKIKFWQQENNNFKGRTKDTYTTDRKLNFLLIF